MNYCFCYTEKKLSWTKWLLSLPFWQNCLHLRDIALQVLRVPFIPFFTQFENYCHLEKEKSDRNASLKEEKRWGWGRLEIKNIKEKIGHSGCLWCTLFTRVSGSWVSPFYSGLVSVGVEWMPACFLWAFLLVRVCGPLWVGCEHRGAVESLLIIVFYLHDNVFLNCVIPGPLPLSVQYFKFILE